MRVSSTLVLLVVLGFFGAAGCSRQHAGGANGNSLVNASQQNTAVVSAPAEFAVTASQLLSDWRSNPKAMDRYAGKIVEITAKFESTAVSGNDVIVILQTGDPDLPVTCRMAEGAGAGAQVLAKGEAVKLKCTGGHHKASEVLSFDDCQLKKLF